LKYFFFRRLFLAMIENGCKERKKNIAYYLPVGLLGFVEEALV
jgi:hypothetical protein